MKEQAKEKSLDSNDLKITGTLFFIASAKIVFVYLSEGAGGVWKKIQSPLFVLGINAPGPRIIVEPRHAVLVDSTASAVVGHAESVPVEASKPSAASLALQTVWHGIGLSILLYFVLAFPVQLARRLMKRRAG